MTDIQWEEDPRIFNFHNEIPGKVKMHTRTLNLHDWVKIDKTYPDQMKLRDELFVSHKDKVFVSNPDESTEACKWELFELLVEHLPKRFPDIFEIRDGKCIYNKVLERSVSILKDDEDAVDPLIRAGMLTQEDWIIIEWSEEEQGYILTAGILYFPMRWSLQEKFNKSIALIHEPVKEFAPHLQAKVYDLFKRMVPESSIWRANWAVFNDLKDPLHLYTPTGSLDRREDNCSAEFKGDETGKELLFRAEYQTLRKLPKTKCIVFGIRTYQRYLADFEQYPSSDAEALIKAIETLTPNIFEYKGAEFWKDATIKYLNHILKKRDKGTCGGERLWAVVLPVSAVAVLAIAAVFALRYTNS